MKIDPNTSTDYCDENYKVKLELPNGKNIIVLIPSGNKVQLSDVVDGETYGLNLSGLGHHEDWY